MSFAPHIGNFSFDVCVAYEAGDRTEVMLINAAEDVESAREVKKQTQVNEATYIKLINYAKVCANLQPKTTGSAPYYVWMILETAHFCRLSGIEVCNLTEDKATEQGLICKRTKGTRTNIAEWNPGLRAVWELVIKNAMKYGRNKACHSTKT